MSGLIREFIKKSLEDSPPQGFWASSMSFHSGRTTCISSCSGQKEIVSGLRTKDAFSGQGGRHFLKSKQVPSGLPTAKVNRQERSIKNSRRGAWS